MRHRAPLVVLSGYRTPATVVREKEVLMLPLLMWILGVPGLIILLLLVLGIIRL